MTSSLIIRLFLFLCLLLHVSAELQRHQITARPGDDVTLPCEAPDNVAIAAVEWSRYDLKGHVYARSDWHVNIDDQHSYFKNRVQLKNIEMKNGNLSLVLKKVNYNDEGRYECSYRKEGGDGQMKLTSFVQLIVRDQLITAQRGDDVTLPCRAPGNITIVTFQWTRADLNGDVYTKRDGHVVTDYRDPYFWNRVQLKDDEMKNGDLSLVLKKVTSTDPGIYQCYYKKKTDDQSKLLISVIHLDVEGHTGGPPIVIIILIVAGLVGVGVGVGIYMKRRRRSEKNPDVAVHAPDVHKWFRDNDTRQ